MPTIWLDSPGLIARNDSLPIHSSVDQVNPEEAVGTLLNHAYGEGTPREGDCETLRQVPFSFHPHLSDLV